MADRLLTLRHLTNPKNEARYSVRREMRNGKEVRVLCFADDYDWQEQGGGRRKV
jgi:hypothetical protein